MPITYLDETPGAVTYLDEETPPVVSPPVADWRAAAAAQMRPLGAPVGLPERPSHEEPLETPEEQAKRAALVEETRRAKGSRRLQELDLAAAKGLETGAQILSGIFPTTAISRAAQAVGLRPIVPPEHVKQIREGITSAIEEIVPRAQVPEDAPRIIKPELGKKINEALTEFGDETLSSFTSLDQAALLASGAPAPKVVGRLFELGSILSIPEATEQLKEAVKSGDAKQITKAGAGLGMSLAITAAIERGLAPKPAPVVPPVTGRALELAPRIEPPTRPPEAAPVAPIAPVRPPTATETTPIVPPAEMPTTPTATGVRPAIRLVGGKVVVGDAGKTHPDIISENKLKADEIDQRGFVNEQGQFMDREQTAAATGVPTTAEPARQHSTDLPEAKAAAPQPISKAAAGKALRRLVAADRDLAEQLAANHPSDLRLNEDGTRVLADVDPRARGPGTGGTAGMTTDFINWLLTTKGEGIAPDALAEHMADVNRAREIITGKKTPTKPPPTEPTPAKEPWQMTAVEARRTFPTLSQEKWDAAVTAAWKDGRLAEDSAPVQSMMRSKPRDFGEIDAVINGRMAPSKELLERHPDLKPTPAPPPPAAPAAAKVETEVRKVAATQGQRPAKEVKSELVQRLEAAVEEAHANTSDYFPGLYVYKAKRVGETSRLTDRPVEGTQPLADWLDSSVSKYNKNPNSVTDLGRKLIGEALERKKVSKVTIEIPGDGTFTVWNTKDNLQFLLERAKKISTKPGEPVKVKKTGISKEDKTWVEAQLKQQPPAKLEARDEGFTGKPLEENEVWLSLQLHQGIGKGGKVNVVFRPEKSYLGQIVHDPKTGEVVGIEINRANISTHAQLDWVMEHEVGHAFGLANPEATARLRSTLTPEEWTTIQDRIESLGYSPEVHAHERTALAVQRLAESWRGRNWFERLVGNVMRYASDLGIRMTRLGAESAAVRGLAQSLERIREGAPTERAGVLEARIPAYRSTTQGRIYDSDTFLNPPRWTDKFPAFQKALFKAARAKDAFEGGSDVTGIWNQLTGGEKRELMDRGWAFKLNRNNRMIVNQAGDAQAAKAFFSVQEKRLSKRTEEMQAREKPPIARLGGGERLNKLGDPYGTTYHATPADWAEWQRLLSRPMMEEGIWPAREAMKNKYGGMPPQPPLAEGVLEARAPKERREWTPVGDAGSRALFGTNAWELSTDVGKYHIHKLAGEYRGQFAVNFVANDGSKKHVGIFRNITEAKRAAESDIKPPPMVGPGAQAITEPQTKAQIEQLEESFRNIRGQRVPFTEKIKEAFNLGERAAGAVNAVGKAVAGLKASGDYLISLWKGVPKIDELLRAKGELSKEMNVRGWHIRQTIRTMAKAVPRAADQAAIAKWIDAGGDRAALERGLAEAPDKYKQAYRDALNLKGDLLVSAQNAQNYFEARLQEAIDAGVLKEGVEDYLHRIYERTPERAERAIAYVQSALLKPNPSLARKRVFQWDWEAEKLGWKPVQSFIPRIAHYEASLSKAIASRAFIRRATEMRASDGRPVIDIKGVGIPIESPEGVREGTLIKPSFNPQRNTQATLPDGTPNPNYRGDYVNREYPSLSRWKWAASDAAGKPIFVQGDVAIHPEFVGRIDSLLKPSLLRTGRQAKIFRPLMGVSSTFKQTMLDLSGFHQVQITVHGLEHRVWALPTGVAPPGFAKIIREIDFADPNVDALLRSGVTLGGEHYMPYREGLIGSALTRHVPLLGPATETYHNWLFQDYIPRIKMTMALHALERNRARYAGKMTDEQILFKTANEANAAFGELNYTMLERSQTARDISRLIMLAPDFLEARARFAGAAFQRGGKMFGHEQRTALLFGALTMWLTARVLNKMISGQYHDEPENAFAIVVNGKSYGLRTVQGDIMHAATKPVEFIMHRLNPVYTRIFVELASGRDEFGRKRTPLEAVWDTVSNIRPIALRSSEERNLWESMVNAFGITARRYNEVDRAFKLAQAWKSEHGVQERGEFIYDPQKDPLRSLKLALVRNDDAGATEQIRKLLESKTIDRVKLNQYFNRYATMPFTGSKENDKKFIATLSQDSRQTVEAAREHKKQINQLYRKALAKYDAEKTLFAPPARVPAGKVTYLDPLGIESGGP